MNVDTAALCRYFTAHDACRLVREAHAAAVIATEPPAGEPWVLEGSPYATPTDFVDAFVVELQARLGLLGLDRVGSFTATNAAGEADFLRVAGRIAPERMPELLGLGGEA